MKILFSVSEMAPLVKTGGLADVAAALPKTLRRLGHDVRVVLPRYYDIDRATLEHIPGPLGVEMGPLGTLWAGVYFKEVEGVPVYFIDYELFFGRKGLYNDERGFAYNDNDRRFIFFAKAALNLAKKIGFKPDVIHANDWHTAVQPLLLNTILRHDSFFADSVSLLTIHNLQHQGLFAKEAMDYIGVGWEHFNAHELEAMGGVNLLKGGIFHADSVNTVSRRYAHEIRTPAFGFGLHDHIAAHAYKLFGILNGVDYEEWNPAHDPYIARNYDIDDLEGKALCKADLQRIFSLEVRSDIPLVGFVGRLVEQKGITLMAEAMEGLLHLPAQFVLLGTGEPWAEGFFKDVAARYPNFACHIGYSNELAHKIEAGSDLFLMPSLFEPCGLNQIYSLRYGTLPVVHAVGGLDDTIRNFDPATKRGTGFKFYEGSAHALYHTLKWAVETWLHNKEAIAAMQKEAMSERFSWEQSARHYLDLYHYTIYNRRVEPLR